MVLVVEADGVASLLRLPAEVVGSSVAGIGGSNGSGSHCRCRVVAMRAIDLPR